MNTMLFVSTSGISSSRSTSVTTMKSSRNRSNSPTTTPTPILLSKNCTALVEGEGMVQEEDNGEHLLIVTMDKSATDITVKSTKDNYTVCTRLSYRIVSYR